MKVCTDSCLLGAWVAEKIEMNVIQPVRILDIGSGTGLLSLMLAQKSQAMIDAVEINEHAFWQTKENFNESQWSKRLQVFHSDIKSWPSRHQYDLVISNPPFFENNLKSGTSSKNLAKHDEGLTLNDLIQATVNYLDDAGTFATLLPSSRLAYFKKIAGENGLYVKNELLVRQTPQHPYFRALLLMDKCGEKFVSTELAIKDDGRKYTKGFMELLKDYYL